MRLAGPPSDYKLVDPFMPVEIRALLDTALRREECAGIKLANVNWRHITIRVIGKGRK